MRNARLLALALAATATLALPASALANAVNNPSDPPSISGTARDGQTLTGSDGTWDSDQPITQPTVVFTAREWLRCDSGGANCSAVAAASGHTTYILGAQDVGHTLKFSVSAQSCSILGLSCSGSSTATSAATAVVRTDPSNDVAPTISGTAQDGSTLSITPGTNVWSGTTSVTLTYQWRRCDTAGVNCVDIATATGTTYQLTANDVGKRILVRVTGSDAHSTISVDSAPTATVTGVPPTQATPATFSGSLVAGQTLTATDATFTGTQPITVTRQWQRCSSTNPATCTDITGATGSQYTLVPGDVGSFIRVADKATNVAAPLGVTVFSAISGPVTAVAPIKTSDPSFSGTLTDRQNLTATNANFSGTQPITVTSQWQRCTSSNPATCSNIPGATGTTYTLTPTDVGMFIRFLSIASNIGGTTTAATALQGPVAGLPPVKTADGSISPSTNLKEGQQLTATDATFDGTPPITVTRRWQRCASSDPTSCADIGSATGPTYTLVTADVGSRIRLVNVAVNVAAPLGVTVATPLTSVVGSNPPTKLTDPSFTGTLTDGQALTGTDGTFSGSQPITVTRQWQRCTTSSSSSCIGTGVTGLTYNLTSADVGKWIHLVNTATNVGGTTTAGSFIQGPVAAIPAQVSAPASFTGTLTDKQTLTGTDATYTGSTPITVTRRWQRCTDTSPNNCHDITGATGSNYTLTSADVNNRIRFVSTGSNAALMPGGASASDATSISAVVSAVPPAPTANPTISGTLRDGRTVTASGGTFSGTTPLARTYQFQRCDSAGMNCVNVGPNGSGNTYTLGTADVGNRLQVIVTASNASLPGGGSAQATSPVTAVVAANRPPVAGIVNSPSTGTVGEPVTFASNSTDPDGDALTYAWDLDGDGQFDDSSQRVVSHIFNSPGNYTVSLRVTDSHGNSDTAFVSIPVVAKPTPPAPTPPTPPSAPTPLNPFPRITIHGRAFRRGTRVTVFSIVAPRGATIDARCRGKGCPFRRVKGKIRARRSRVRAFQRAFGAGAVIEIRITARGKIGKYVRFRFRSNRAPTRLDRCLNPGSSRPRRCPRGVR